MKSPMFSVVVMCHDMCREAPRTLYSLSRRYQRGIELLEYEVIVVDNGSTRRLDEGLVRSFGPEFSYHYVETASHSPVSALNAAVRASGGRYKIICIDGARILSPGMLRHIELATRLSQDPIVATLAWHLGPKVQRYSMLEGYDQDVEDRLLDGIDWCGDGYELFSVSCLAGSSAKGWFLPISESNCIAISSKAFDSLGGFDEAFVAPGGGYANLDFYSRACAMPSSELFVLLGEGTFHQFHGGAATNPAPEAKPLQVFADEYRRIRGKGFTQPTKSPTYLGALPHQALPFLKASTSSLP